MAAQEQLSVIFAYSLDRGLTWSTKTLLVGDHRVRIETTVEKEFVLQPDREVVQTLLSRVLVDLTVDARNFDEKADPLEANALFMQKWIAAPLKRVCTGRDVWGFAQFTAADNTNYVVLRDVADPDIPNAGWRNYHLALKCAKRYVVT